MTNRIRTVTVAAVLLAALAAGLWLAVPTAAEWEFVVDVEARSPVGDVLAGKQVRAGECQPDGQGACVIEWSWEALPEDAVEWVRPYFLSQGHEIPVVHIPTWCEVDLALCQSELQCDGETAVVEPSAECLAALDSECNVRPDERGFWYGGDILGGGTEYAFYEPIDLQIEWYDYCPSPEPTPTIGTPPPTYTPGPTYTPEPTPTCRPTWTPIPTPTLYPPSTPYSTSTPWPDQPPWE